MYPAERGEFDELMRKVFDYYKLPIHNLEIWFKDLEQYKFSNIRMAFNEFRQKKEIGRFMPRNSQIIEILEEKEKKEFEEKKQEIEKCSSLNCGKEVIERHGDIYFCREHCDDWILKNLPGSLCAEVVRMTRAKIAETDGDRMAQDPKNLAVAKSGDSGIFGWASHGRREKAI